MTTSDPTPDVAMETALDGWQRERNCDDIRHVKAAGERLAAALRSEQSARQELLESHEQAWNNAALWKEESDTLQQRIDAALAEFNIPGEARWSSIAQKMMRSLIAPTESKEADPQLDPAPFLGVSVMYGEFRGSDDSLFPGQMPFTPRPEYSQNPADYGIEASHE